MRKLLLFCVASLSLGTYSAQAQFELGASWGYQFNSRGSIGNGYVHVNDGLTNKFDVNFKAEDNYFGFSYTGIDTDAYLTGYFNYDTERSIIRMNYYELHYERVIPTLNEMFQPYGGMQAGWFQARNQTNLNSLDRLFLGGTVGVRVFLSDRFGLKGYANINVPIEGFGASFYAGTGGSGAGVSTYSTMAFFSLGGGLFIQIGGDL